MTRVEPGVIVCRLASQAPEVDGLTFIEGPEGSVAAGDMIRVVPREAMGLDLLASLPGSRLAREVDVQEPLAV